MGESPFFIGNHISRNEMKTETYIVKRDTPCLKNLRLGEIYGEKINLKLGLSPDGWECWDLFKGFDYDITNLKLIEDQPINDIFLDRITSEKGEKQVNWSQYYSFELWDEDGHIGDYKVKQIDFEENCDLMS